MSQSKDRQTTRTTGAAASPSPRRRGDALRYQSGRIFGRWGRVLSVRGLLLGLAAVYPMISFLSAAFEGWTWYEGLYYGMAAITTVGFGDLVPVTLGGRLVVVVLVPLAIVLLFGVGFAVLASGLHSIASRRGFAMIPRHLKDHILIIGYGRRGRIVVDDLLAQKRAVCVVERSEEASRELERRGIPHVIGNALDVEPLERAGVGQAATAVVTFENDADSVYLVLELRELCPDLTIIAAASSAPAARRLELAGATRTIQTPAIAGDLLAKAALGNDTIDLFTSQSISSEHRPSFGQIVVQEDAWAVGHSLAETARRAPGALVVMACHEGETQTAPSGELTLRAGMALVLVGRGDALAAFSSLTAPVEEEIDAKQD